jgi:dihydroflavonol-4-reductase
MTVALTGATGLLGANLAVALREAGHAVRATRRASSKTAHLDHLGLDWVEADLRDPDALVRAFDGVDAVFHCAAAVSLRRELTPLMQAVNIDGTDHVIEACRAAGTGRLVHCSSTVTVGVSTDGRPCTEASPWNLPELGIDDGYSRSKRASEQRVLAEAGQGLDAVVVNPGFMFGPLDQGPSSGELLLSVVTGQVPVLTPGGNSFVDVRSVARGMVAAWHRGRAGERYILAGHNLPYAEAFPRFCAVAGVRPPRLRVPFALAALPAALGTAWERLTDRDAKLSLNALRWSYTPGFAFSSEKAERELGYEAGPLEPALVDALRWWQSQGMLGGLPALPVGG